MTSSEDFRNFALADMARRRGGANPDFFEDTVIESEAAVVPAEAKKAPRRGGMVHAQPRGEGGRNLQMGLLAAGSRHMRLFR